jgi:NAD(P)-dependent dehydrogenase (short-subunit alcohol dehydrogenase family)
MESNVDFVAIIAVICSIVVLVLLKIYFNGGKNIHHPDLTGKIVVITGANTGIGFVSALEMSKLNPSKIIFACRSESRALEAMGKIGGSNLEYIPLDLNDLNSVKEFAATFNSKYDKLDILLNNAGIMALPKRESTAQGLEK